MRIRNHLLGRLETIANHLVAGYRERRTSRIIGELPRHIRKDIGWPDEHRRLSFPRTGWTL